VSSSGWDRVRLGSELLKRGSKGDTVAHLQGLLNQSGAGLAVDGDFGPLTDRAVRQAQANRGVAVDGVVGPDTAAALDGGPVRRQERADPEEAREARDAARGGSASGQEEERAPSSQRRDGGPEINVRPNQFERYGLRSAVLSNALEVFQNAWRRGDTTKTTYSIIDFSLPSTEKRLFVIDLARGQMLFNELVTHGGNSGGNHTTSFSNTSGSNQSSIGLARTAETYESAKFGSTALRMDGLEEGYNDNMRSRAIVMHQADYATQGAIDANGGARLGRSQGCPALDPAVAGEVIEAIKNGTLIYSYYPDADYMRNSEYQS
jgi:peptidoglycan hydrolase-like protein with peptidoglycan-binding domain